MWSAFEGGSDLVLARLEESPVRRYQPIAIPTLAERHAMSTVERETSTKEREEAGATIAFADADEAEYLIGYLGTRRYGLARALIARLYADHPSRHVRLAAGHALVEFGGGDSLDWLISRGDSSDERRRWFGLKARLARSPGTAVDLLAPDAVPSWSERDLPGTVFELLESDARRKAEAGAGHPWVFVDPRWLDVSAKWARKGLEMARAVLDLFPAEERKAALARMSQGPQRTRARPPGTRPAFVPGQALELVRGGDLPGAWRLVSSSKASVRDAPYHDEATEVAAVMMKRAATSLGRIAERLAKGGCSRAIGSRRPA